MQVVDYYTPLRLRKSSLLWGVIFPTILAAFALIFFYDISVNSFDFTFIIPFIILPVILWLVWRGISPLIKPALRTYELPFVVRKNGYNQGHYLVFEMQCTLDTLHYKESHYERETHYQDIEYVTLHSPGSGVLNLNLQCKASPPIDIQFSQFSSADAVVILDIILRNAPHATCNELVTAFRQGKYLPTDTSFLA